METKEPVLRESKMKLCWAFGVNSGAKPHVVWIVWAIVLPFATFTSVSSAEMVSWLKDRASSVS